MRNDLPHSVIRSAEPRGRRLASPMFSIAPTMPTLTWVSRKRGVGRDDDVGIDDEVQPGPGDHPVHRGDGRLPDPVLARRPVHLLAQRALAGRHTAREATAPTSAPVEKCRSPAAVTTEHRIHGSSRTSAQIALIGSTIDECSVFARSGRLMVMYAMWSRLL